MPSRSGRSRLGVELQHAEIGDLGDRRRGRAVDALADLALEVEHDAGPRGADLAARQLGPGEPGARGGGGEVGGRRGRPGAGVVEVLARADAGRDQAVLARDLLIGGRVLGPGAVDPGPGLERAGAERGVLDHGEQRAGRDPIALVDRDQRDAPGHGRADDRVELGRRRDHPGDVDQVVDRRAGGGPAGDLRRRGFVVVLGLGGVAARERACDDHEPARAQASSHGDPPRRPAPARRTRARPRRARR
jgi:hypothetical protein